jgi:hypothetical protein
MSDNARPTMTKLEYLFKKYDTIVGWYKQSEEKAKFLVTLNTLIIGVVNGLVFVGADKAASVQFYDLPIWILLALIGIALIGSFLFVIRAMWPRHHSRDTALKLSERIWFFGDIASITREEYTKAMEGWTEKELETAIIIQNHILATNVWDKYESLNRATALSIVALVLLFGLAVAYAVAVATS